MKISQALTIAGSDSGGGAGIQADIKTMQEFGVFATSVITAITAQNSLGVHAVQPLSPELIAAQIDAVATDFQLNAVKTGMLVDSEVIECVVEKIKQYQLPKLVIDPVMIAKGGHALLQDSAIESLRRHLIPCAYVITPNIPEAEALLGYSLTNRAQRVKAAQELSALGAECVVIKGGHSDEQQAADYCYYQGSGQWFSSPRIDTAHTHGTGCSFSAALCALLAQGYALLDSMSLAKQFIYRAIAQAPNIGHGHGPVDHFVGRKLISK